MQPADHLHQRICSRLVILDIALIYLGLVADVSAIRDDFSSIKSRYIHSGLVLASRYLSAPPEEAEAISSQFQAAVSSNNIMSRLNRCLADLRDLVMKRRLRNIALDADARDTLTRALRLPRGMLGEQISARTLFKHVEQAFQENDVSIAIPALNIDNCPECGTTMTLFPDNSEKRCHGCGFIYTLYGTLFEDSQAYSQQTPTSRHKKYNPNVHCEKWLNQIQACENKVIDPEKILALDAKAVREYTRGGVLRPMTNMTCRQIREWLKDLKMTELNNHAALLRKIITGMHGPPVVPPQLTETERREILFDFSRAMAVYEEVANDPELLFQCGKTRIHNKFYYPNGLAQVLKKRLRGDRRLLPLLSCIHFQSCATLARNDKVWKRVCSHPDMVEDYTYSPTDPASIVGMS